MSDEAETVSPAVAALRAEKQALVDKSIRDTFQTVAARIGEHHSPEDADRIILAINQLGEFNSATLIWVAGLLASAGIVNMDGPDQPLAVGALGMLTIEFGKRHLAGLELERLAAKEAEAWAEEAEA